MIRLQKLLAAAGLGSRRAIEEWIRAGRLTIGGRIAQLGDRADPADDIRLDGRRLELDAAGLRRPGATPLLQARRRGHHPQRPPGAADGV